MEEESSDEECFGAGQTLISTFLTSVFLLSHMFVLFLYLQLHVSIPH